MNFLTLIPVVFEIVKLIEQLLPDSKGKEKFDAAFTAVEQVYGAVTRKDVATIGTAINGAVASLNAAGVFKKSTPDDLPAITTERLGG